MNTNEKLISNSITMLVEFYNKKIIDISDKISSSNYEDGYYNEAEIIRKLDILKSNLSFTTNSNEVLNDILFYESMIYLPFECEQTYKSISVKSNFAEYGFPAICYFYKQDYDWAFKMADKYFKFPHSSDHPTLLIIFAKRQIENGAFRQAEDFLLKAVDIVPSIPILHILLKEVYIGLNYPEKVAFEDQIIKILG